MSRVSREIRSTARRKAMVAVQTIQPLLPCASYLSTEEAGREDQRSVSVGLCPGFTIKEPSVDGKSSEREREREEVCGRLVDNFQSTVGDKQQLVYILFGSSCTPWPGPTDEA